MRPLKLVRFYGSSLPRPRIYTDVKLNSKRVDPPSPVNASLLRWAADAHWSMGGLSSKRLRMQGKIEGRLKKLREEQEDDDSPKRRKSPKARIDSSPKVTTPVKGRLSPSKRRSPRRTKSAVATKIHFEGSDCVKSPNGAKLAVESVGAVQQNLQAGLPTRASARITRSTPVSVSASPSALSPHTPNALPITVRSPKSIERIQRRVVERPLPEAEDSDSEVDLDEFLRQRDRPLRRSTRVSAIRRSFKTFVKENTLNSDSD